MKATKTTQRHKKRKSTPRFRQVWEWAVDTSRWWYKMWKGINGDIAMTIDAHYYLGCGNRGGREREVVYWVEDMQKVTGSLSPGAHPGSYNGQDAYNDMLIADGIRNTKNRRIQEVESGKHVECERLQKCDRPNYRGGARDK